jgi:hypothetical protein
MHCRLCERRGSLSLRIGRLAETIGVMYEEFEVGLLYCIYISLVSDQNVGTVIFVQGHTVVLSICLREVIIFFPFILLTGETCVDNCASPVTGGHEGGKFYSLLTVRTLHYCTNTWLFSFQLPFHRMFVGKPIIYIIAPLRASCYKPRNAIVFSTLPLCQVEIGGRHRSKHYLTEM